MLVSGSPEHLRIDLLRAPRTTQIQLGLAFLSLLRLMISLDARALSQLCSVSFCLSSNVGSSEESPQFESQPQPSFLSPLT